MGFRTLNTIGTIPEIPEDDEERLTVSVVRVSGGSKTYEGIDIRRFWIDRHGEEKPGKGITVRSKAEAEDIIRLVTEALDFIPDEDDAPPAKKPAAKRAATKRPAKKPAARR